MDENCPEPEPEPEPSLEMLFVEFEKYLAAMHMQNERLHVIAGSIVNASDGIARLLWGLSAAAQMIDFSPVNDQVSERPGIAPEAGPERPRQHMSRVRRPTPISRIRTKN